jgi:carbonic anhydrase
MAVRFLMYRLFSLLFILFHTTTHAAINNSGATTEWGYVGDKGPVHWASLDKNFTLCAQGKSQSPIDIPKSKVERIDELKMDYSIEPALITHDGDVQLNVGKQQIITNDGHTIQVSFEGEGRDNTILFSGIRYKLKEFHLHTPSETMLQHQDFPMEIHFVHQGANGRVAVVAVFIVAGQENKELQTIIEHIPDGVGREYSVRGLKLNPKKLLPDQKDYYQFQGSLTTPPCTEGLQWIVFAKPITASTAQIQELRKAIGGNNNRLVQPLNRRAIVYSAEKK